MFLWFNSNNKCNSNGKVKLIVIGFLNVLRNSNSNSKMLFKTYDVIVIVIVKGCLNISCNSDSNSNRHRVIV